MNRIDPEPKKEEAYLAYDWPVVSVKFAERREPSVLRGFVEVAEQRRSKRVLTPASHEVVVGALLFALKPRFRKEGDALARTRGLSLSAGALHPISVLLFDREAVFRVNAEASTLDRLKFSESSYAAWLKKCRQVLPQADGTFMVLVADMARPHSAYENSESLVWRDAGAMLQTMSLVSEVFGLGFCPLGMLGNEVVAALPENENLLAVGAAVIGFPSTGQES